MKTIKPLLIVFALFLFANASAQSFDKLSNPCYAISSDNKIPSTTLEFNITGATVDVNNPVTINIYNITGQLLYSVLSSSATFSIVITVPTGVYIIQALQGESASAIKPIIYQGLTVPVTIAL